jgi:outer membrane lipoprotein-sorting protein
MFGAVLAVTLLITAAVNPIQAAIDYYRGVAAYQATLKSSNGGKTEVIQYSFKKPGLVRMDFVTPFKGAVLIYDPGKRRAKLWPFGYGGFPAMTLSPGNGLIQSSTGQRVDRSDVGALYDNAKRLQDHGTAEVGGVETVDGHEVLHVTITGSAGFSVGAVARYQLWLDRRSGFPLKVLSYGRDGRMIEAVEMGGLKLDPEFPEDFFKQ